MRSHQVQIPQIIADMLWQFFQNELTRIWMFPQSLARQSGSYLPLLWCQASQSLSPSGSRPLNTLASYKTFQLELMSIESISFTTNVEATWLLFFAKLSLRLLQQPAAILLLLLGHLLYAFWIGNNCSKNRMNEWAYVTVPYTLETMSMVQRVKYKQEVSPVQGPSRMP